jgi:hypothetical protein
VAAYRFEHVFDEVAGRRQLEANGYEDAWDSFDEDELEMTRLRYRQALRRLAQAFPELELRVSELVDGVRAAEHNSRPCPCGHGRLAQWPWVLQTQSLGYCDGSSAWCTELITCRSEWIPPTMGW